MISGGSSQQSSDQWSKSFRTSNTYQQAEQAGYFSDLYGQAGARAGTQLNYFPGQSYAEASGETLRGISGIDRLATQGHSGTAAAGGYNESVLAGDYLNSNPYLDQTFDAAARGVTRAFKTGTSPGIQSAFDAAGRGASGSAVNAQLQAQDQFGRNLGELATSIYGGNYQQERGRMEGAAGRAPGIEQMELGRYGAQIQAGGVGEGFQRERIAGEKGRYDFGQGELDSRLAKYKSLLGGSIMESEDRAGAESKGTSRGSSFQFGLFG